MVKTKRDPYKAFLDDFWGERIFLFTYNGQEYYIDGVMPEGVDFYIIDRANSPDDPFVIIKHYDSLEDFINTPNFDGKTFEQAFMEFTDTSYV